VVEVGAGLTTWVRVGEEEDNRSLLPEKMAKRLYVPAGREEVG
jgi:hypothetical protein